MQIDRQTLLFFIIMFLFLSLPSGNDQPHSSMDKDTLIKFQQELKKSQKELAESNYGGGYGNITGFKLSYLDNINNKNASEWPLHKFDSENPWVEEEKYSILPNAISDKVKQFWGTEKIEAEDDRGYLLNISGRAFGEFQRVEFEEPLKEYRLELPQYLKEYYELYNSANWEDKKGYDSDPESNLSSNEPKQSIKKIGNLIESEGKVSINIKGYDYNYKHPSLSKFIYNETTDKLNDITIVELNLNLMDYEEREDNDIETTGIYFQKTGSLISITRSAKFLGNHGLAHLTLNEENFNKSRVLMSQLLNLTNIERDISMDDLNSNLSKSQDQCEFISYFQFKKTGYTVDELRAIDEELMNPGGKPMPKKLPNLQIQDYLIYSPDCGVVLTLKPQTEFEGLKVEVLNNRLKHTLIGLLVLVCSQLIIILRQTKEMKTPGQLSVVSSKTLFILGFQDSLIALFFLLLSTLLEDLYLLLACVAVMAFIMCGIFELRFMVNVLTTQANERGTTWWQILRGSTRRNDREEETLPTTNPPVVTGNEESRYSNSIFATGFSLTIIVTFLILNASTWRIKYRRIFEYIGLFAINSYWVPQFLRNTLKNRRKSFSWEFIIATTIIRMLPIWYLSLNPKNPLRHHKDPLLVAVICSWTLLQLLLLALQYKLGPRFWLNEKWLPKAYDYQPVLFLKDLETGFASDLLANITAEDANHEIIQSKVDCAICMNAIKLPILTNNEIKKRLHKKEYMITPCYHIFHEICLQDWMKYKLQCPVCRNSLPPV